MKPRINMEEIAKGLGAERRGKVAAIGGYFGAMQLVADVQARFRAPRGGGRATDPNWTKRRLVRMNPRTLKRLEELAQRIGGRTARVEPMQVAALLLERTVERLREEDEEELLSREAANL